jgi:hypothetical protein
MKYLLIILLTLFLVILILILPFDFIFSLTSGWNTILIPDYIKYFILIFINLLLPLIYYFKFKHKISKTLLIGFFILINLFYFIPKFIPFEIINEDYSINIDEYYNYITLLKAMFIATIIVHISFIIYLLNLKTFKKM